VGALRSVLAQVRNQVEEEYEQVYSSERCDSRDRWMLDGARVLLDLIERLAAADSGPVTAR